MNPGVTIRAFRINVGPALAAALVIAALVASLFFNGVHMQFYAASGALLVGAAAVGLYLTAAQERAIDLDGLTLALNGYWIWLGLNALLSQVPGVSVINFWWLGALPLAFWAVSLSRAGEGARWRYLFTGLASVATALAVYALLQSGLLLEQPSATFINRNNLAAYLNLFALPVAAWAILLRRVGPSRATRFASAAVFAMLLVIFLIGSRGALLGLIGGMSLLVLVNRRELTRREYFHLFLLIAGAFLAANLVSQGYITQRSLSLADPQAAGASRWLIWERAWAMLQDVPWYGIGIGLFWLAFPPYRDPADGSGGFYVHNDFLQIWIEAGWPGLLLFLLFCLALVWRFAQFVRTGPPPAKRLEATGLFAGLLAVGGHSLFTFNLYLMPTLLAAGALLARLHRLTAHAPLLQVRAPASLKPRFAQTVIALGTLFPLLHFGSHFGTEMLRNIAAEHLERGELDAAHRSLVQAQRLTPRLDVTWYADADVLRTALEGLDHRDAIRRHELFKMTLSNLERAERINPYRAHIPYLRGRVIAQERELVGAGWQDQASTAFEHALRIDPRFLPARLAWADLLLQQGRDAEALTLLREGLPYWYAGNSTTATYLWRTARLHASFEEWEAVDALAARFQSVLRLPAPFSAAALRHAHHGSTGVEVPRLRDVPEGSAGGEASP